MRISVQRHEDVLGEMTKSQQIFLGVGAAVVPSCSWCSSSCCRLSRRRRGRASPSPPTRRSCTNWTRGGYRLLTRQVEEMQRIFARRRRTSACFPIARKDGQAGIKANVKSINPARIPLNDRTKALVDMKIDRITRAAHPVPLPGRIPQT